MDNTKNVSLKSSLPNYGTDFSRLEFGNFTKDELINSLLLDSKLRAVDYSSLYSRYVDLRRDLTDFLFKGHDGSMSLETYQKLSLMVSSFGFLNYSFYKLLSNE